MSALSTFFHLVRTLLVSINEATKLPDGTRCPAFALVVRDRGKDGNRNSDSKDVKKESDYDCDDDIKRSSDIDATETRKKSENSGSKKPGACSKGTRECLLVIRGTASSMDWSINMDDLSIPLTYRAGPVNIPTEVTHAELCFAILFNQV